jgi:uncharacterized protein YihD (DUF1040 family)
MRDPNRIPYILEMIKQYWEKHPELRLCQLLSNIAIGQKVWDQNDLYYLEDEKLIAAIVQQLSEDK